MWKGTSSIGRLRVGPYTQGYSYLLSYAWTHTLLGYFRDT